MTLTNDLLQMYLLDNFEADVTLKSLRKNFIPEMSLFARVP